MRTQRTTAEHLVSVTSADDVLTIKANQPGLPAAGHHALSGAAAELAQVQ
ncbi:MAG: hypothetical protein WCF33_03995 [Pseudonocardiaceae bacterium]